MTELDELIQYWKDRLADHYPFTGRPLKETIRATIAHLERLNEIWKKERQ